MMFLAPDQSVGDPAWDEAIAAEIRQIQERHLGQQPATARTIWRENLVVCVLQGVFTEAEARRVAAGEFELVREERIARRKAIEPLYLACIESVTGRPVRAQMSEVGPEGVAFEAFILG